MIPREEFWRVLESYGAGIMPAQFVFYIAAVLMVVWCALGSGRRPTLFAKAFLAVAFAWNGIVFYLTLGRGMAGGSHGNYIFGVIFIIVSVLFAVDLFRGRMQFAMPPGGWQRYATLVLMLLVFCYPVFGILLGHSLTSLIMPGTFPCPTAALALLLLTTALPQIDRTIYLLLLLCAIPFTPFFQIARYGVYEDSILLASGIYALVLLVKNWKAERLPMEPS
jgi:uncharacterized membrane protein YtjA (UPF0391 family)